MKKQVIIDKGKCETIFDLEIVMRLVGIK